MILKFKPKVPIIIFVTFLSCIQFSTILAQDNANVKEPPIPVYIISPDSLSASSEGIGQVNGHLNTTIIKKIDTLQQQVNKSAAESTVHFIWLYTLVALLGIMNIVNLYSTSRSRKELAHMKRLEHQKMLLAAESSVISQQSPAIQETPQNNEPAKTQPRVRTRKPRTSKPRVKKEKKI